MQNFIPDYLADVLAHCAEDTSGHVADYIPELAKADPHRQALAIATADGSAYSSGEDGHEFTIQSISKPFIYALAIDDHGLERVLETVGVEPSGEAFNELSLEGGTGRPLNPMINAGAIATHQLLSTEGYTPLQDGAPEHRSRSDAVKTRTARVLADLSAFAGRQLAVDYAVADSEYNDAYRNLAIANMLRTYETISTYPTEAVRGYIDQCAVLVTVNDIAMMAATLANNGIQPATGERIVSAGAARQALSVMATCGMYDASGAWLSGIGIPAKSGVSGGIIGILPGQVGIASFSPRLDPRGNSVRGVEMFQRLSQDMGLHLMINEQHSSTAVRGMRTVDDDGEHTTSVRLQGTLRFSGAERALRAITEAHEEGELAQRVVFDYSRVEQVSSVGRTMMRELRRRLEMDGHVVVDDDPEGVLAGSAERALG